MSRYLTPTLRLLPIAMILIASCSWTSAQPPAIGGNKATTLFTNVRVFDGKSEALTEPMNVLVQGNLIAKISDQPIPTNRRADTMIIDGGGRTLMPGLIDAHWHTMLVRPSPAAAMANDVGYTTLVASDEAEDTLLRGFTTVRDLGGPAFSLKRAIDEGLVVGPRIFPSGAMITITSGHGDFRQPFEVPRRVGGQLTRVEQVGGSIIADSPDEVRLRTREQLLLGASQIKLTAGGGVASPHSPIDVSTFTEAELRAAVEAAENWGTYVTVHAYTPAAIQRAIAAGVTCIDHGHLMDEATAQLMAEKGIWLSIQPFLDDEDASPLPPGSQERAKQLEVTSGTDRAYALAKKHKLKTAFGTDILFSAAIAKRQGAQLAKLLRWYTAAEALKMATADNAELLAMSGKRSPYSGKLGVVEEGALADLLLVDGDPLADLNLVADPEKNFVVIMKDGVIHKNSIVRK
ncbi:MAG TPA: amidohydrolase family protein [Phycisphaerae bacterium]|nr:amidohydrolase family protein [Phycisphaerae bacterium]